MDSDDDKKTVRLGVGFLAIIAGVTLIGLLSSSFVPHSLTPKHEIAPPKKSNQESPPEQQPVPAVQPQEPAPQVPRFTDAPLPQERRGIKSDCTYKDNTMSLRQATLCENYLVALPIPRRSPGGPYHGIKEVAPGEYTYEPPQKKKKKTPKLPPPLDLSAPR